MRPLTERASHGAVRLLLLPAALGAQRDIELHIGRWGGDQRARTYEVRASSPLGGAFTHGLAGGVFMHDSLGRRRAFYGAGYELQIWRRRATFGPYALLGAIVGLSTDTTTQEFAILWSLGGGVEWRPLPRIALGLEGRYRAEDRGPSGFWNLRRHARTGLSLAVGVGVGFGGGNDRAGSRASPRRLPPAEPPLTITGNAAAVVRTALDAVGTPYRWGGTEANGFDCSGLVHYAYAQHGIRLPRMSRDQAHAGAEVPPVVEALQPGDILLFSARPAAGVTHVGLYVGEQKFIHSSSRGVTLSRLDLHDPDGVWWLERWVGARRVMP